MSIVSQEEWDDEMVDAADILPLDIEEAADPEPYFDINEILADEYRAKCEVIEHRIIQLTTPGWRFLFSIDESASEESVNELRRIEQAHFAKYQDEIDYLNKKREYYFTEWQALAQ